MTTVDRRTHDLFTPSGTMPSPPSKSTATPSIMKLIECRELSDCVHRNPPRDAKMGSGRNVFRSPILVVVPAGQATLGSCGPHYDGRQYAH